MSLFASMAPIVVEYLVIAGGGSGGGGAGGYLEGKFSYTAGQSMTVTVGGDGAGTTGSRTLAAYGMATAVKVTSTSWIISWSGLT